MVLLHSEERLAQGDAAPAFSLRNVDNQMVSLDQFKGMPVAILFVCNHCPYVKPKMEEIGRLAKEFAGKAAIVCINPNDPNYAEEDSFEHMQDVAKRFGFPYYLVDETQGVARAYGAVCTPDPFLFDKSHRLAYHGRINDAMSPGDTPRAHDLRDAIIAVLDKKNVTQWFNPSMGCSIKWKQEH